MCEVVQPRARVGQGQAELRSLSKQGTRPAEGRCQTSEGESITVITAEIFCFQLKKSMKKYFRLSV